IEFAIFNSKALVAKKMTSRDRLLPTELRGIIIAAVARYAAFSTRVPDASGDNWTLASDLIKYFPSISTHHLKAVNKVLKHFK
ncbi:Uncharacterized protein FKW44_005090, partial [Caligus rogercresseyi]